MIKSRFTITDDSGFMALINAESYTSFVNTDWDFAMLTEHFLSEMNKNNLIIWCTGIGNTWTVDFLERPLIPSVSREFSKIIEVTNNNLHLTNFEDLSASAQFIDDKLPSKHNSTLNIPIENGFYNTTVRQISDPDSDTIFDEEVNFEIIFDKINNVESNSKTHKIFWMEY